MTVSGFNSRTVIVCDNWQLLLLLLLLLCTGVYRFLLIQIFIALNLYEDARINFNFFTIWL